MSGEINQSKFYLIGHENINLRYKCKKCNRVCLKPSLSSDGNSKSKVNKKECKA